MTITKIIFSECDKEGYIFDTILKQLNLKVTDLK